MYVRRKTSPGRADYYQLVESTRVEGKPRQRVILHLGQHPTVEAALKSWPRKIGSLRRRGRTQEANSLNASLELLRSVLPKDLWRVAAELADSEGVRWIRAALEPRWDWSQCRRITVRRGDKSYAGLRRLGQDTKHSLLDPYEAMNSKVQARNLCLIVRVVGDQAYPVYGSKDGKAIHNEDETLVWLIAHAAGGYLGHTGQVRCRSRIAFADEFLEAFRTSRQAAP